MNAQQQIHEDFGCSSECRRSGCPEGEVEMAATKPIIYLFAEKGGFSQFDVLGYALAEDGQGLASHMSSSIGFSQHDMGLTSDWKHNLYNAKYPEGYQLVWLDASELDAHKGFQAAYELNKARAEAEGGE